MCILLRQEREFCCGTNVHSWVARTGRDRKKADSYLSASRNISDNMRVKIFRFAAVLGLGSILASGAAFPQVPNQSRQLRIQIWSELDPFPGGFEDEIWEEENGTDSPEASGRSGVPGTALPAADGKTAAALPSSGGSAAYESERTRLYSFAIGRAKELTPFFLSGMLSGWTFEYTPYDKGRGVEEFFEFGEITPFDWSMNSIEYREPVPEDSKLLVWAYCDRTEVQQLSYRRWSSINLPKVRGRGSASVEKGFEGIKESVGSAIRDAVREYWRIYSRNKPKEITGRVLLIGVPRVYIYEGQYKTDLEFFLETDRIVKYTYF